MSDWSSCPSCKFEKAFTPDDPDPFPNCPSCGWASRWKRLYLPPVPDTEDDFRNGLEEMYRRKLTHGMDHLRLVWEIGRWLSNALDTARCNGWPVGKMIEDLRDRDVIRWRRSAIYSYAQLGREPWKIVAKSGSVRRALTDMRNRNRTPEERREMKAKRHAKEREIESLAGMLLDRDREISDLADAVKAHAEAERLALKRADAAEADLLVERAKLATTRCPSCRAVLTPPHPTPQNPSFEGEAPSLHH